MNGIAFHTAEKYLILYRPTFLFSYRQRNFSRFASLIPLFAFFTLLSISY